MDTSPNPNGTGQPTGPPVTNVYVTQQMHAPVMAFVPEQKNVALAVILGLFFGPIGMLYVGVTPALIMFGVSLFGALFTFGLALFVTIPICAIWAGIEASNQNSRIVTMMHAQSQLPYAAAPQPQYAQQQQYAPQPQYVPQPQPQYEPPATSAQPANPELPSAQE